LSGWFVLVDDKAPEGSTGALWSERARATLFACPNVVESAVPINSPAVVQGLTGGADIAIVFRFISETFGAEEYPYIDPQSGILINKFGLTDQESLDRADSTIWLTSAFSKACRAESLLARLLVCFPR